MIRRILMITALMTVLAAIAAPIAWMSAGWMGVAASSAAAAICLIAGVAGLITGESLGSGNQVITQSLVPMMVRMSIALGVCMVISLRRGPVFESGFVYYLLLFYLVSLGPETALMIRGLNSSQSDPASR